MAIFVLYWYQNKQVNQNAKAFIALSKNRLKFPFFLFSKLPSAFFSGVKVISIDYQKCMVSVPYKWFSQNPFKSTYFACLSMAAEMSTGLMALMNTYKRNPSVSMLVTKIEGEFFKKAVGLTTFVCEEGTEVTEVIDDCILSHEAKTIRLKSTGTNAKGQLIAIFYITWSFKAKILEPRV